MDDAAFTKLFSDPRMVGLLIRRHVPEWAGKVDFATLRPLPTELVDERLRLRYPDMAWHLRTPDGSADLALLIEFQGRPERHMALRTTKLPPVHGPVGEGDATFAKGHSAQTLEDEMQMRDVVDEWERGWDEVRREARAEGREEGIEQGQVAVLTQQVGRKFGQATAEEVQRLIGGGRGPDRVALMAAAILDCDTPEDFLARVGGTDALPAQPPGDHSRTTRSPVAARRTTSVTSTGSSSGSGSAPFSFPNSATLFSPASDSAPAIASRSPP